MKSKKRKSSGRVNVISLPGKRDTRLVGLLRLTSAFFAGAALVGISGYLGLVEASLARHLIVFTLITGAGLCAFAELAYGGRAARNEEKRLRRDILNHQFEVFGYLNGQDQFSPGNIIQMMSDNSERLTEYRQVYFGSTLAAMFIPFMVLLYITFFVDWVIGLTVLAVIPLIPLLLYAFMRFFRQTSANSRKQRAKLSGRYLDAIRHLVLIRLLGAGNRIESELRQAGEANRVAIMKLLAGNQLVIIVVDGLFSLVLICLTVGLVIARLEHLVLGEALAVVLLTILLLEPLQQVAGFFYIGMGGMAAQKKIGAYMKESETLINIKPAVDTKLDANVENQANSHLDLSVSLNGNGVSPKNNSTLEITGVSFDYGRGPVFENLNFSVQKGQRVAIIGDSGAGKSTLLNLLRGLLQPQKGKVSINGLDVSRQGNKARQNAVVSQSTWMFTGTIADNLRLAKTDATEEEMWIALEKAQIDEEIKNMPDGLHTYLGEGAKLISGGQAQRISLARALLSGRKVLLLDEPTSQIDIESEARLIKAISSLPRDWTILIITHRYSLLELADQIWRLKDGVLTEEVPSHAY